jgi:hypothetical protein
MGFEIIFEKTEKTINWKLTIFGLFFLILRIFLYNAYQLDPGNPLSAYDPEVFHTSYFISICMCLALICSFRVKLFNTIAIVVFPAVIFSFPLWDIPHIISDPLFSLQWWNALTIHSPILIIGLYMIMSRKVLISKETFFIGMVMIMGWYFAVDNKINATPISGILYPIIAGTVLVIWLLICWFFILRDVPKGVDPMLAPIIKTKGFKWK